MTQSTGEGGAAADVSNNAGGADGAAAEGGAAGAAAGDGLGAAGGEGAAAQTMRDRLGAADGQNNDLPEWAKGVADDMRGETAEETVSKLNARVLGLRKKLSEGGADDVPSSADEYKFDLGEDYVKAFGDGADDPMLKAFSEVALAKGMGQADAQEMVKEISDKLMASGMVEMPLPLSDFYDALGGEEAGGKRIDDMDAWFGTLAATGAFGDSATDEGKAQVALMRDAARDIMALSPNAIKVLEAVRKGQNVPDIVTPGGHGRDAGFELTRENIQKAVGDPRYDSTGPNFDPAYRQKIDELAAQLDR